MDGEKPAILSKTIWVNILVMLVGIVQLISENEYIINNPKLVGYFVLAVGVLNVIIRFLTTEPVTTKLKRN